ncbi:hypothetical protein P5673_014050 [Acropora cervicornis]|uniref:Uncharacterized protein n=1 Tax=Acropora cervicornis TaxID=6130 RepID=A0AAD9V6G6_ACRCE|nr:hypothetical protein P5673_014050 [Acropora cervicornis]
MRATKAFQYLVALLSLLYTLKAQNIEVIETLMEAYSTKEVGQPTGYFSENGKGMFEQVSMLDAMALAKRGKPLEASQQLTSLALGSILDGLPIDYRAAGGLLKLMQADRSYFKDTMMAVQANMKLVSRNVAQKLMAFKAADESKQRIFEAWKRDMERLQRLAESTRPSPKNPKIWQVYGSCKYFFKQLRFPPTSSMRFAGPISDILGIVVSSIGLYDAIQKKNTLGIVNSVLGIVGGVVALSLFTAAVTTGVKVFATIGGLAGAAFFVVPLLIQMFWPRSLAIETANKLTEISQKDLQGNLHQLSRLSESGSRSFGWMYQVNSGIMIEKKIRPDTPIKFLQPSCATPGTPCDPKRASYKGNNYLVLGTQRKDTYTSHEFKLDVPYDFFGAPTEPKFCGNTVNLNTVSFKEYIEFLGRKYQRDRWRLIGSYQRNVEVDTTAVPQYNDVDIGQFVQAETPSKRMVSQLDEVDEVKCEPASDRISIDELALLNPRTGKVTINTGRGKDVLSIQSMVGRPGDSKTDYLVSDLGEDGNLLSVGAALGIGATRDNLVVGVFFDNTGGQGKLCYVKADFVIARCVGSVKAVTIFKGSRLHDKVVLGSKGPYTVIQNRGANSEATAL